MKRRATIRRRSRCPLKLEPGATYIVAGAYQHILALRLRSLATRDGLRAEVVTKPTAPKRNAVILYIANSKAFATMPAWCETNNAAAILDARTIDEFVAIDSASGKQKSYRLPPLAESFREAMDELVGPPPL
jgi:hypothetical protein